MDVTPLVKTGSQIIQSYAGGQFRISGQLYQGPVIVMEDKVIAWAAVAGQSVSSLSVDDFSALLPFKTEIDVVLLGSGAQMALLPPALRAALKGQGFSVDIMDTGAACRTYNVLMAEGRRVAAALFPV